MTDRISEGGETDTYNNFQLIGTPVGKKTREIYFDFVGYLHLCNYFDLQYKLYCRSCRICV